MQNSRADPRVYEDRLCCPGEEVEAGDPALLVGGTRLGVLAHGGGLRPH